MSERDEELDLDTAIDEMAGRLGVPKFYKRMVRQESGGNDRAVSPANARGRFQVMPATLEGIARQTGKQLDINNPLHNAFAGLKLLSDNYKRFRPKAQNEKHAWMLAVAGYHGNPERVEETLRRDPLGIPDQGDGLINTRDHIYRIFKDTTDDDFRISASPQQPAGIPPVAATPGAAGGRPPAPSLPVGQFPPVGTPEFIAANPPTYPVSDLSPSGQPARLRPFELVVPQEPPTLEQQATMGARGEPAGRERAGTSTDRAGMVTLPLTEKMTPREAVHHGLITFASGRGLNLAEAEDYARAVTAEMARRSIPFMFNRETGKEYTPEEFRDYVRAGGRQISVEGDLQVAELNRRLAGKYGDKTLGTSVSAATPETRAFIEAKAEAEEPIDLGLLVENPEVARFRGQVAGRLAGSAEKLAGNVAGLASIPLTGKLGDPTGLRARAALNEQVGTALDEQYGEPSAGAKLLRDLPGAAVGVGKVAALTAITKNPAIAMAILSAAESADQGVGQAALKAYKGYLMGKTFPLTEDLSPVSDAAAQGAIGVIESLLSGRPLEEAISAGVEQAGIGRAMRARQPAKRPDVSPPAPEMPLQGPRTVEVRPPEGFGRMPAPEATSEAVRPTTEAVSGAPKAPQRWQHRDFGLVFEQPNQSGVREGFVRVMAGDGKAHVIRRPNGRGDNNRLAIPVREAAPAPEITPVEGGQTGATEIRSDQGQPEISGQIRQRGEDVGRQDLQLPERAGAEAGNREIPRGQEEVAPPVKAVPKGAGFGKGLTRTYQAGQNRASVTFTSLEQRDLFDLTSRGSDNVSLQEKQRRAARKEQVRDDLAKRLGVTPEEVMSRAFAVRDDVRAQMKGVRDGEARALVDNVTRPQPEQVAQREEVAPPRLDREQFREGMKRALNLSDEGAEGITTIVDARARAWAKEAPGRRPEDYIPSRFAGVVKGGKVGSGALAQLVGEKGVETRAEARANLETARKMEQAGKDARTIHHATGWERGKDGKWRYEIEDALFVDTRSKQKYDAFYADLRKRMEAEGKDFNDYGAQEAFIDAHNLRAEREGIGDNLRADLARMVDRYPQGFKNWHQNFVGKNNRTPVLGDIIPNAPVFKSYPELRDMKVAVHPLPEGTQGSLRRTRDESLIILSETADDPLSTLHHEIQHEIQRIEGFARGGSPDEFIRPLRQEKAALDAQIDDINRQMREASGTPRYEELMDARSKIVKKYQELEGKYGTGIQEKASEQYRSLAGEVEARNVQSRLHMPETQRRQTPPVDTEDVSRESQIVLTDRPDSLFQDKKAAVEFLQDGRAIVRGFAKADVSSAAHEFAHVFRRDLSPDLLKGAEDALGVTDGKWNRQHEESFARGFERYLKTGKAPDVRLRRVFESFKTWLTEIYGTIRGKDHPLNVRVSPELAAVFDKALGGEPKGEFGKETSLLYKSPDTSTPAFFANDTVRAALGLKAIPADATSAERSQAMRETADALVTQQARVRSSRMNPEFLERWARQNNVDEAGLRGIEYAKTKAGESRAAKIAEPADEAPPVDSIPDTIFEDFYGGRLDEKGFTREAKRAGLTDAEIRAIAEDARAFRDSGEGKEGGGAGAPPGAGNQGRDGEGDVKELFQEAPPSTQTPEFKRWFGDSKVVDEKGEPLVVYHGTTKDVSAFSGERAGENTGNPTAPFGHFFTPHSGEASRYSTLKTKEGSNVIPAYLSLKNPYLMSYREFNKATTPSEFTERGMQRRADVAARFKQRLVRAGHDGIIIAPNSRNPEYVAFEPTQIKSATGNRGTFDPDNPNILYQTSPSSIAQRARAAAAKATQAPPAPPRPATLREKAADVINVPRSLKSSVDLSAAMRQGAMFTLSHPVQASKIFFGKQLRSLAHKGYADFVRDLEADAWTPLMNDSGLHLSSLKRDTVNNREEAFVSKLAQKVPGVKRSEQAYVTFLDAARSSWFKQLAGQAEDAAKQSGKPVTPEQYKEIAKFINRATGRGDLGKGALNDAAPILNAVFFAPRYAVSKLQVLDPRMYARMPEGARGTAVRQAVQYYATIAAVAALLKGMGAQVGTDPEDSEFMKVRAGDTRYDLTGGHAQYVVLAARLLRNMHNRATGGKDPFGKDLGSNLKRFLRYKLAPVPAAAINLYQGRNAIGEETSAGKEAVDLVAPLYLKDLWEAYQKEGAGGLAKTAPGFVGVGVNTYSARQAKVRPAARPERPKRPARPQR